MNINTVITPDNIAAGVELTSKKRVLEMLSQLMTAGYPELNPKILFEALMDRERLGTTGMGNGIAIPHGRINGLEQAVGGFIQLKQAISFDAPDNQPVDLVFGLLVPESATAEHLELLSSIAQFFNNPENCAALRAAKDNISILKLISD
jgi:PTS system nitrogen regulatory IIA component